MDRIHTEFDLVQQRQAQKAKRLTSVFDSLSSILNEIEKCHTDQASWTQLSEDFEKQDFVAQMNSENRSFHTQLSKCMKALDKVLSTDTSKICRPIHLDVASIDKLIAAYLYSEGFLETADCFVEGIELGESLSVQKDFYLDLFSALRALELRDIDTVINYYRRVRETFTTGRQSSGGKLPAASVEFHLIRLKYIAILRGAEQDAQSSRRSRKRKISFKNEIDDEDMGPQGAGEDCVNSQGRRSSEATPTPVENGTKTIDRCTAEALAYAQEEFPPYFDSHYTELKRLMGALVYAEKLSQSPYKDLLGDALWDEARILLKKECCWRRGVAYPSLLETTVAAGNLAMPMLDKMKSIMETGKTKWDEIEELPVEVPLGRDLQFHSIFSCPVSREKTSQENPPVVLKCGHVICKACVTRIGKNNSRFKCPTCPVEQTVDNVKEVWF